ncbi:MAG: formylglycine-generating enzyme family protein [Planctomycetota bacterium]
MDEQIRAIQEYVYNKYIDPASHGSLDEESACRVLDAHYRLPDHENDPDCFYPGVLYFELGFELEDKKAEYFQLAKYWLERHRALTGEDWDVVDDRLLDIADFFEEQGIQVESAPPPAQATPVVTAAPHIVEEVQDHGPMMLVAGGTFLFGPEGQEVNLAPYYIDKFPVTNRQYEAFCRATGYRWPKYWTDERFNDPDAPVVGVSVADALKFCRWVGKGLPSEEQWEKASRGSDGRPFPWGEEPPQNGMVCYGRDPLTGRTDPVTAHPDAASPFGVHEMAGNVWEWTATVVEDNESVHIIKGGCYNDPPDLLRSFMRLAAVPKDKYETIGFRCVKPA